MAKVVYDEFKELMAMCDFKYSQFGDTMGSLVTSKINGARIFLPQDLDSYGQYWSSNLNPSPTGQPYFAYYYNFVNGKRGYMAQMDRYYGFMIRPVWDPEL